MKKMIVGMFLSTLGTTGVLVTISSAAAHLMASWNPALGRYLSTLVDLGLAPWLVIYSVIFVIGLLIVRAEYYKREDK